ncbi:hypothetical protein GGR57DRAFT_500915 [Xylariaceae sp. FL1272]|nr:hypothetical protein GGR57DRAFT_500915 [Xylariaceae sp. FL1272]
MSDETGPSGTEDLSSSTSGSSHGDTSSLVLHTGTAQGQEFADDPEGAYTGLFKRFYRHFVTRYFHGRLAPIDNAPPSETADLIRTQTAQQARTWLQAISAVLNPTRFPIPNPFSTGSPTTRETLYEQAEKLERGDEVRQLRVRVLKRIEEIKTLAAGESQTEGDDRAVEQPESVSEQQQLLKVIINNAHDKKSTQPGAIAARRPNMRNPAQTNRGIDDETSLVGQVLELQLKQFLVNYKNIDKLHKAERYAKAIDVANELMSKVDDFARRHNEQRHQGRRMKLFDPSFELASGRTLFGTRESDALTRDMRS